MKVTRPEPVVEASLGEIFDAYANLPRSRVLEIAKSFGEDPHSGEYSIPSPLFEGKGAVLFNHSEILRRFATMSRGNQEFFLLMVDKAMDQNGVDEIRLSVGWSHNRTRIVMVKRLPEHRVSLSI